MAKLCINGNIFKKISSILVLAFFVSLLHSCVSTPRVASAVNNAFATINPLSNNLNNNFSNFNFKDNSSLKTAINSLGKSNFFSKKSKRIGYSLSIVNNIKEMQYGNIAMQIANNAGQILHVENYPFNIKKRGTFEKEYVFESSQLSSGMYVSKINVTTNKYSDTLQYTFGYDVEATSASQIGTTQSKAPNDFVNFWYQAQNELSGVQPNYNVVARPDIKNDFSNVYEIQFTGINYTTIYGWLTLPKSNRKKPVIYQIADYQSEIKPEFRRDVAVLSLNTRLSGASSSSYNKDYSSLGLVGLNDKNNYILKGAILDAFRGADFLQTYANTYNLNLGEMVIVGNGFGAVAAAFTNAIKPYFKATIMDSPSFLDFRNSIGFSESLTNKPFPAYMYSSYMYANKNKEAVLNTLNYFDAVNIAPYINGGVLVGMGTKNMGTPASSVYNFYNQLRTSKKENYTCTKCEASMDNGFYGLKELWIKEMFGLP